jgi:hypothetical protein
MSGTANPFNQASAWRSTIDGFDPNNYSEDTARSNVIDVCIHGLLVNPY